MVWGPMLAFPSVLAAHSSSGLQQSTTVGTAGQHRQREACLHSLQPPVAHSPPRLPQSRTRMVPAGVACWLPRGRTEGQSTAEPTPAWPRSRAAGPWPCSDSSWVPARITNAEGSRKRELMCRVQSTPERLPVPPELVPETRREDVRPSLQPRAELHSLVLDLGPFGFQGQVLQEKRKH